MFAVPRLVEDRARSHAPAGLQWLAALPGIVAELADRWQLSIGAPLEGGTAAFVVGATRTTGEPCVLKINMALDDADADDFRRSVRALKLADGRGCVAMLDHDEQHAAMLLERLGPNLADLGCSVDEILEAVADTLNHFWRPVDVDCGLRTGRGAARWLADFIVDAWDHLGQPCDRSVIDHALRCCGERADAFDPTNAVLVHGDAHGRLVHERAEALGGRCDVDPHAIWQWGFVERVSTGLANLRNFSDGSGELFLEVAARCQR